jgi:hypothetical protein
MSGWAARVGVRAALTTGVLVAVASWAMDGERSVIRLVVGLVLFGLFYGALAIGRDRDQRDHDARVLGTVDPAVWYPVQVALQRGELPDDPALDPHLARLVDDRQRRLGGTKSPVLVAAWAIAVLTFSALAALVDPGWLVLAVLVLVAGPVVRHRKEREADRLDRLQADLWARRLLA